MDRRDVLRTGGLALLGYGLGACASKTVSPAAPRRPPVHLVPANVSFDRVIRTTVGLRPHRPSGFLLRAERVDHKTLIHNYGHGGSGMSLTWGTGQMAAEMALEHLSRRAAVLGCGAAGLTAARQLQKRGFDVTIYAKAVPPDTTSNMSWAGFTPTSGLVNFRSRTPEWEEQFRRAVVLAYRQLQLLVGSRYGVSWINGYTPTDDPRAASGSNALLPKEVESGQVLLQPGEHPFPTTYAVQHPMMRIEPSIYLEALMEDFVRFGGRIVIRELEDIGAIQSLSETLVVNCMGLGAKAVFDDQELTPLKGQLTVVIPQPEVNYATMGGVHSAVGTPGIGIHMMSRSDGIVLGGTSVEGDWSLDVDEEAKRRIVEGHIELFGSMHA